MREPSDSSRAGAEILTRAGVDWALIGALAALRYRATPRLTVDADFLAWWTPDLAASFRREGYDLDTDVAIDGAYIEHWAAEWDVADRWTEARARRG